MKWASRAIALRDLQNSHKQHIAKLQKMKPSIDMRLPTCANMKHLQVNAKRIMVEAERNASIDRENKILLGKMSMGADIAWYASSPRQFTGFSLSQHESYFMLLREPSVKKCAGCHSFNMSLRCSSHPAPSCK